MKLRELGEFGLIERIRAQVQGAPGVLRGIGDDAAQVAIPPEHQLLTSTDLLIEEVHFRFSWSDHHQLGRKAVAVNLSDIAAMGGSPRYLYLGLACPGDAAVDEIEAFLTGVLEECARFEVVLVGGDTCRSPGPWMISVTVEGVVPEGCAIGREGARPGDLILVTGTLGDSALALHGLMRGDSVDPDLMQRHNCPEARVEFGLALARNRIPTAMIDLSDGLLADLEHILQASAVDGVIDRHALPLSEAFRTAQAASPDLLDLALAGGEDYELLFTVAETRKAETFALGRRLGLAVTQLGEIVPGRGRLHECLAGGKRQPIVVSGYDHFCRPGS